MNHFVKHGVMAIAAAAVAFLPSFYAEACTTAIVGAKASASGRPMMWKQRDTGSPGNVIAHVAPEGKYAYTAIFRSNDKSHNSAYAGINDQGFAIMNNLSYNITDEKYRDRNGGVMTEALQNCASVDEFEQMLREMPRPIPVKSNFGVIDASGAAAYIEAGGENVNRFDVPQDGWLVRTNFSLSGIEGKGSGYARYETARYIMEQHKGKFAAEDLIDGLGRSFRNQVLGRDFLKEGEIGYAWDEDFIPRPTTVSSVCIEGVGPRDRKDSGLIWAAPGYTPACYSIPVWVAAGDEIAPCLAAGPDGQSEANMLAEKLQTSAHNLDRDAKKKYIDLRVIKAILENTRTAEAVEMKEGRALDEKFRRKGLRIDLVQKYNGEALRRFEAYRDRVQP